VPSSSSSTTGELAESATETPGLTALDVERAGSMTDEGGASAAIVESADVENGAP